MCDENGAQTALARVRESFDQILCRAGIGEEENDVVLARSSDGDGLHMRVGHGEELSACRGKEMRRLHGDDHRAALSHAQHPVRLLQKIRRADIFLRTDKLKRLRHGADVGRVELFADIGKAVVIEHLAGERVGLLRALGDGVGNGEPKSVVPLASQPPAEARHGRLCYAACRGELGDAHVLRFSLVRKHIIRRLFLCGSEIIILCADSLKNVYAALLHTLLLCFYFESNSPAITSVMMSMRGRWNGPLKVEPLVDGSVGSPSRRR